MTKENQTLYLPSIPLQTSRSVASNLFSILNSIDVGDIISDGFIKRLINDIVYEIIYRDAASLVRISCSDWTH